MSVSVNLVHPTTGAPLLAGSSLENAFMLIAQQIFTYTIPRTGRQHTAFLKEPIVLDCQSYCLGISMITNATKGQTHEVEAIGNVRGAGVGKVT